ncbi:MAG: exodeoxyribonuclease VII small subunit [Oscillospiraceae bacterium]|nr:exodeoxyribonuclease VII small subunit [Oscillospiraceae bacterium]
MDKKKTEIEKMTLEAAMGRLEEILRLMDDGKSTLEDSLALFEEGTALVRFCSQTLEEAKLRVKEVTAAAEGQPAGGMEQ